MLVWFLRSPLPLLVSLETKILLIASKFFFAVNALIPTLGTEFLINKLKAESWWLIINTSTLGKALWLTPFTRWVIFKGVLRTEHSQLHLPRLRLHICQFNSLLAGGDRTLILYLTSMTSFRQFMHKLVKEEI